MNNIYIYNDFNSLLNLIIYLINNNITPYDIKDDTYQALLFDNLIYINLSDKNVTSSFINKLGHNIFKVMFYVYLSTDEHKELIIYYFYKNALKYREKIFSMYNLKCVNKSIQISRYVNNEAHKYKGFVRFKELENKVLYAQIEPVNNVLVLISRHFKNRLKNEYWIIEDTRRKILSLYDKSNFYIMDSDNFKIYTDKVSGDEALIEDLWKTFYKTVSIASRRNERCRMNFMPKRYWKYLVEVSDEL